MDDGAVCSVWSRPREQGSRSQRWHGGEVLDISQIHWAAVEMPGFELLLLGPLSAIQWICFSFLVV